MKTWTDVLGQEKQKPYFQAVLQQVRAERAAGQTVYPPEKEERLRYSAVFGEYIQRVVERYCRFSNAVARLFDGLGGAGRFAAEHGSNGARASGAFPRGLGLGNVHGHGDSCAERIRQPSGVPALGQPRAEKSGLVGRIAPFGAARAASFAVVGLSRLFRLPPFFAGQCVFAGARIGAD